MSRGVAPRIALAGVVALGIGAAAAITFTPASHDFGKVVVKARGQGSFRITAPASGWTPSELITLSFTGPDAADFLLEQAPTDFGPGQLGPRPLVKSTAIQPQLCNFGKVIIACDQVVLFVPSSLGPKSATLVATGLGTRGTAQLKGEGVFSCLMKVVFCNYAQLYDGSFRWKTNLSAPKHSYTETVDVAVVNGVATCNGAATATDEGRTTTGKITGTGLIAVEFENTKDREDEDQPSRLAPSRLVYRITVACPSPAWPPTEDNPRGTPSQPAELGHTEMKSYDQQATAIGIDLIGSSSYPAPESDALNSVTGQVQVSWSLKRQR